MAQACAERDVERWLEWIEGCVSESRCADGGLRSGGMMVSVRRVQTTLYGFSTLVATDEIESSEYNIVQYPTLETAARTLCHKIW